MSARKASGTRLGGTFTGDPTVQIRCSMTLVNPGVVRKIFLKEDTMCSACSTNRDAHVVYLLPMHHLDLFIFAPVALQKGERDTQVQFRRRRHRCFGMFLRSWVDPDAGTVVLSLVWHICEPRRRGQNFYCLIHFPLRMIALGCLREPSCNGNVTEFRGFTSSPDAVSKTTSQAETFLSQLVRDSRILQIKLIVEPESNKILALYPPATL
ncbi:hypothetical protein Tsp_09151 [Trichinella spiralis]|uniref:hypothetical protein n=1 Tax=Trichinella spiralis TaxID=6334 RepID=UPI0001EFCD6E|nr:hypothetical protein Tsp_09151 [Trichinella spiralis]